MSYFGCICRWLFFSLGFGLVPLWVPMYLLHLANQPPDPWSLAAHGILMFYGWGLIIQIIAERWGELFAQAGMVTTDSVRNFSSFLIELVIPLSIGFLSYSVCTSLFQEAPNANVIRPQIIAASLAVFAGLYHNIRITYFLRRSREEATAGPEGATT